MQEKALVFRQPGSQFNLKLGEQGEIRSTKELKVVPSSWYRMIPN